MVTDTSKKTIGFDIVYGKTLGLKSLRVVTHCAEEEDELFALVGVFACPTLGLDQ